MGRKTQVLIVAIVALLIGGAVAGYAYDNSKKDTIAEGVTVSGIDVGGMSRAEATGVVTNRVLSPQRKPVEVKFEDQTYRLPAKDLKIHADVDGSIDRAMEESRQGSLPARLAREVTGGSVDTSVPVEVDYSRSAVNQFVREVAGAVAVDPVDAGVGANSDSLSVTRSKDGRKLRDNLMTTQLTSLLDQGSGDRTIAARVSAIKPAVTTDEVAGQYPTYLTLDRGNFTLRLWKDLKLDKSYTVAVGQVGLDTPAGLYSIQNKQVDPAWYVPDSDWAGDLAGEVVPGGVPENPLKARWMGIFDGAGIHGTDATGSLGSAASHGCVRMAVPDVVDLYEQVDVGTPIYIG